MTMWLQDKSKNFVVVDDNEMPSGTYVTKKKVVNVWKFVLKFQAVAQKTANNFRGYFLPHPVGLEI